MSNVKKYSYIIFFLLPFLSFSQNKGFRVIIIPENSNPVNVIQDSIFSPFIRGAKNYILPDDTTITHLYKKDKYNIYRYGRNKSSHGTSNYHFVYHLKDRIICTENKLSLSAHKKMNNSFFKELRKMNIPYSKIDKKKICNEVKKHIKTNNLKALSGKF